MASMRPWVAMWVMRSRRVSWVITGIDIHTNVALNKRSALRPEPVSLVFKQRIALRLLSPYELQARVTHYGDWR